MDEGVIIAKLRERDFYLPKPRSFLLNPWLWVLLFFPLASTVGLAVLAYFGFGFAELQSVTNLASLTRLAATCLALGEVGSIFAAIEVFRKYGRGETRRWDWVAVAVSSLTTAVVVAIGWAWAMDIEAWWQAGLRENSALILSVLAVLDTVLAGSEAGLYLGSGSQELKAYQEKYQKWAERQERLIKKYQEASWTIQEKQWMLELNPPEESFTPSDFVPQAEDKTQPPPLVERPELHTPEECVVCGVELVPPPGEPAPAEEPELSPRKCWCGRKYLGDYKTHFRETHLLEIRRCKSPGGARKVLKAIYGPSHQLPTREKLAKWLAEVKA